MQRFPFRLHLKPHKRKKIERIFSVKSIIIKRKSNCLRKILKLAEVFLNHHLCHLDVTKTNAPIRSEGLSKQTIKHGHGSILAVAILLGTRRSPVLQVRDAESKTYLRS